MQQYARDFTGSACHVRSAIKGKDYNCLECGGRVRVREGVNLRAHFFHIQEEKKCRQAGKTQEHITIQELICRQIGEKNTVEEMHFPEISRIGDVVWAEKKLVFEVQCSPISAQEIEERNSDYARAGYDVVWILYDKTFNKKKQSQAELILSFRTHYYSDGEHFYDLLRPYARRNLFVNEIQPISFADKISLPKVLQKRFCNWAYYARGDYLWAATHGEDLQEVYALDQKRPFFWGFAAFFRALWRIVLERSCR
jgi:competence protein CoiA